MSRIMISGLSSLTCEIASRPFSASQQKNRPHHPASVLALFGLMHGHQQELFLSFCLYAGIYNYDLTIPHTLYIV